MSYSNYLIGLRQWDEARELVDRCLKLKPKDDLCLGNSTIHALNDGDNKIIEERVDSCLKEDPEHVSCLHNKGNVLLSRGNPGLALKSFKMLKKVNGNGSITFDEGIIFLSIGQAYTMLKNMKEAKRYFELSCQEGEDYGCISLKRMGEGERK